MIVTLVLTLQSFIFMEQNLREPLIAVAQVRVKQIATDAINQAISSQIAHRAELEQLVDWRTNYSGDVTGFMLNYAEHMKISSQVVDIVKKTLDERVHVTEHVPIGQALDSAILSSFGPSIPIRFESAGAPQVDLGTRREDAGINMLLVTVYVRITAEVMIYIPFETKPEIVSTEIPISYILVKGDVPMYYFDANGNAYDSPGGGSQGMIPPAVAAPPETGGVGLPTTGAPQEEASTMTVTP
ncbi:sporulation protein YunB [Paenibacillus sp. TRM 82003]|nr:sporulation protein YunB [Paenibacillus sp. TRM 82003]